MTRIKYELDSTQCITPCPFGMTIQHGNKTLIKKVGNCLECETCEYYNRKDSEIQEVICNHPIESNKYKITQEVIDEYRNEYHTESFPAWLEKKIVGKRNLKVLKTMNELITGDISLEDLVIVYDINNPESYRALDNVSLEVALDLIKQEKLWYYEKEKE